MSVKQRLDKKKSKSAIAEWEGLVRLTNVRDSSTEG